MTFKTHDRELLFVTHDAVDLVHAQILRAAGQYAFALIAYCYMPDHLHMLVEGVVDQSDCLAFIRASKQYSGYYFRQRHGRTLWQRYGFERVVRDPREMVQTIGYIVGNPVRSGLALDPADYPFLGSQCYSRAELLRYVSHSSA